MIENKFFLVKFLTAIGLGLLVVIFANGCRNDDYAESLKWSCAQPGVKEVFASVDCYNKMTRDEDPVLRFFRAVPIEENGKIVRYSLVEKPASALRQNLN
ncbi:MAG: hypothetical protein NT027_16920 [Proteobacteria bacterium]|nr:hypothetical protein [Pseudomonadota bacterium]